MATVFIRLSLLVFLSGVWFFINTEQSHACSCAPPGSSSEELAHSTVVFIGEVTSKDEYPPPYVSTDPVTVEFQVDAVWKDPLYETTFVTTAREGASYGFTFTEGEKYIVYSRSIETTPEVHLCGRTRLFAEAQDDLRELEEGHSPEPGTSAPTPTPPKRSLPIVGGCTVLPYPGSAPADLSGVGLMVGLVWFEFRRRTRP